MPAVNDMISKLEEIRQVLSEVLDSDISKAKTTYNKFWRRVANRTNVIMFIVSVTIELGYIVEFFRVVKNESKAIDLMPEDD